MCKTIKTNLDLTLTQIFLESQHETIRFLMSGSNITCCHSFRTITITYPPEWYHFARSLLKERLAWDEENGIKRPGVLAHFFVVIDAGKDYKGLILPDCKAILDQLNATNKGEE